MEPVEVFRSMSDGTRLACLLLLRRHGELCVCELVEALQLSQPKISRHLSMLRNTGLVVGRREGQWVHYRLAEDAPAWLVSLLDELAVEQSGGSFPVFPGANGESRPRGCGN